MRHFKQLPVVGGKKYLSGESHMNKRWFTFFRTPIKQLSVIMFF